MHRRVYRVTDETVLLAQGVRIVAPTIHLLNAATRVATRKHTAINIRHVPRRHPFLPALLISYGIRVGHSALAVTVEIGNRNSDWMGTHGIIHWSRKVSRFASS